MLRQLGEAIGAVAPERVCICVIIYYPAAYAAAMGFSI